MLKIKNRKIMVVSGSRADYGLLHWLMQAIRNDPGLILQTTVCGMHLKKEFGYTYKQIIQDGFQIDAKVDMLLDSDLDYKIAESTGRGMRLFAHVFKRLSPDILVILGDRFEMLAAAGAGLLSRIPIAHIHGGEVTQGSYDNNIRHAISKMAALHFVTHKDYARRLRQMGEEPQRIYTFGAPGIENIFRLSLLKRQELEKNIGFTIDRDTAIVTYHPVTLQKGQAGKQIKNLLAALEKFSLRFLFTMPNADPENSLIIKNISGFVRKNPGKAKLVSSLGQLRYLSAMKYAVLMIGNSSSGIIEAPYFKLPVVNIGERQSGRIKAKNIIDCHDDAPAIRKAIKKALSAKFRKNLNGMKGPFGSGNVSERIKNVLKKVDLKNIQEKVFIDSIR